MSCLFVEHLTVIDCAFLDAKRGLVGESWILDLELEGSLDDQGMVQDFGLVKKKLKQAIDRSVDHRLIVPGKSAALKLHLGEGGCGLTFEAASGPIEHISPATAVCVLPAEAVTAQALAEYLGQILQKQVPGNVTDVKVTLRNEVIDGAYYHYTHGLKKHDGHCQRIAHGHRSRLHVMVDGRRDEKLEQLWSQEWRDIYVGTSADVVSHGKGRMRFAYTSGEGEFELELPVDRCVLLQTDSTVERIAEHIASRVAEERPQQKVVVRAYEGVMKGAVATIG